MVEEKLEPLGTSPIIELTVNVYKFWSFLQPTTPAKFIIIPMMVMNVFQFLELYRGWGDFQYSIINAFLAILFFNAAVFKLGTSAECRILAYQFSLSQLRTLILMKNREKFESFIRKMDKIYEEVVTIDDPIIQSIISENTTRARLLTKTNYTVGFVISVFYCAYPLLSGRFLPYNLWVPGLDLLQTPQYEIIYVAQVS